jgi:hypothetical protein
VVEPVLPVVRGPDEPVVGLLLSPRRRVLGPRERHEHLVALLHERPGRRARPLEAHVHVARQAQLDVAVLGSADGLVVAGARVLPAAELARVVEARVAVHRHLDLAVDAADHPQQHVVGVVVGGRPAVRVRAIVLVVPRPDQEHVAHDDPAAGGPPARLEDVRAGQVAARGRHLDVGRPEAEAAGVAVEDRSEHARRVEARQAEPLHVPVRRQERARLAVGQEAVLGDRREGAGGSAPVGGPLGHSRAPAAGSRSATTFPSTSEPGASGSGGPASTRRTASALSSPVTRKTI